MSYQQEIGTYCFMNKQYVEEIQKWGKPYLMENEIAIVGQETVS